MELENAGGIVACRSECQLEALALSEILPSLQIFTFRETGGDDPMDQLSVTGLLDIHVGWRYSRPTQPEKGISVELDGNPFSAKVSKSTVPLTTCLERPDEL